ncbi:MAG: hypothetical protein J2P18_20510 [Nocardia sp.]|nr:hypothetical protein [Nocardia sp.]
MKAKKIAATAILAVGATAVTSGVVQAQPATANPAAVRSSEHGIGFVSAPTSDHSGVATTLDAGSFALAGNSVTIRDSGGRVVASVPLSLRAAAGTVGLTPRIGNAGRTLTLTTQSVAARRSIDSAAETEARKQHNAGIGALIGLGIGAVLGFFLGGVGALVTAPIGAGIGALIGYSTP